MIAVVTDSTADLPAELAEQNHVHIVPALINFGQQTLRDGIDITREAFYALLPGLPEIPTTSSPGPAEFIEVYERALSHSSHVISIHAASALSGIYNAARLAAREVAPDRIHLVDSGQLSMGIGWAALSAVEAIQCSAPIEGVLNSVQSTLERMNVFALLHSLDYLAKSGRVNLVQAGLSNLLSIKPIIELREGVVSTVARVRTWTRALNTLSERVQQIGPLERLAIMHSNAADAAGNLLERLKDLVPEKGPALITNVTTVIGAHVGPGAVGVAAVAGR
jgi:DegV family protein with EDD domain